MKKVVNKEILQAEIFEDLYELNRFLEGVDAENIVDIKVLFGRNEFLVTYKKPDENFVYTNACTNSLENDMCVDEYVKRMLAMTDKLGVEVCSELLEILFINNIASPEMLSKVISKSQT